ncbi:MAG: hypothetical protein HZY75_00485 [Nocardioidaceae bacterium]|nr:MAG: hypothetical protein HZY75_00485 [Nocardioidaceae bacterium]
MASLAALLRIAADARYTDDAVDAVVQGFDGVSSRKAAGSYLRVAMILGLLEIDGPRCEVTPAGDAFLKRRGVKARQQVQELLLSRVDGVEDLVDLIRERPRRIGLLLQEMNRLGFPWAKDTQVRYRLRWLEATGAVCREGRARPLYRLADDSMTDGKG